MLLSGIPSLRPLVGFCFFFFLLSILLHEITDGNAAHPLKKILRFPTSTSFHFLTLFHCFLLFYLWLVSKTIKLLLYWELTRYSFFTGLSYIYKYIPVYIQVLVPRWKYSYLKKTRNMLMRMSVNRTSQCVIKPGAGPWWMFTNDNRGTRLSGTGQERSLQGCPVACIKQSQR